MIDRTILILDIFSKRAKTKEARLQVELAQMQYMLPRLVGLRQSLGRQVGGVGTTNRGAGETKLELDRSIHANVADRFSWWSYMVYCFIQVAVVMAWRGMVS